VEFLAGAMNLEHGSGDHPVASIPNGALWTSIAARMPANAPRSRRRISAADFLPRACPEDPDLEADLVGDLGQWPALAVARVTGFPYYGDMNVTLSIDDELVKTVRKIAVERDTTLTGMVREYLEKLAAEEAATGRRRRERETLERSFERFQFRVGKRTWKRADLHARS